MAILTSVPSSKRRPGTYLEHNILSAGRGLVPIAYRVVLIGAKTSAGTQTNGVPVQVFSESEGDAYFGKGSELALMVRAAFKAGKKYGNTPEIWACSLADPGGGVKAAYTFTITGAATQAGDIEFSINGVVMRAGVAVGDSVTTMALAVKAASDAKLAEIYTTSSCSLGVATFTCNNAGVNGQDLKILVKKTPPGVSAVVANSVPGTGAYDITATLDTLIDRHYHGIAIANHTATDVTDFAAHIDSMGQPGTKRWVQPFLATNGTLASATALATGANKKETQVVCGEDVPELPGQIAATMVTTFFAEADPALAFDDVEVPLSLPPAASNPTDSEIEAALAAGVTLLAANPQGTAMKIVKMVTTLTTVNSAPFEACMDSTVVKTLIYTAIQVDAAWAVWSQDPKNKKKTAGAKERLRSVTLRVLRDEEKLEYLQKVDDHLGELVVEDDLLVATRLNVAIPASVVSPLHQKVGVINLFVE